jgi:hypothetical protein
MLPALSLANGATRILCVRIFSDPTLGSNANDAPSDEFLGGDDGARR